MASKDMQVSVVEFQKEYPTMNLELLKNNEKDYDISVLVAHEIETKNGYIVKKQYKTTKKGTKFTYKACTGEEEAKEYNLKLHELLKQYNKKYNTNYCW